MTETGGGASRTTDPASGTSAATDVSLREFVAFRIDALDRHITSEVKSLRRETQLANENAAKAIEVAAHEATERLAAHNGLIDQMQAQQTTFARIDSVEDFKVAYRKAHEELKDMFRQVIDDYRRATDQRIGKLENFQAKIAGGMMLVGIIGVANLTKVWFG